MSRTVVVTGASGGIGRASAMAAGRRGDTVVLIARGQRGLDAAAAEVERAGGTARVPCQVDVADPDAVTAAADKIEADVGPIDVWINVAFTSVFAPFDQIRPEEFRRVTEVSYLGYVYATMAVLKHMKARDRGTIVQVGSALAYRGIPLQSAYCGAKHAIQGFHESLRCELLHEKCNVHVTMVQMPAVNTPQFSWVLSRLPRHAQPVPPIYQPEVAARAVDVRQRPPAPSRVLGRLQHRGHPRRQRDRPGAAGPLPRSHRVRLPADGGPAGPGRAGEPVGAGRR